MKLRDSLIVNMLNMDNNYFKVFRLGKYSMNVKD